MSTEEGILKFDLTDPDAKKSFTIATFSKEIYLSIDKIKEIIRKFHKHGDSENPEDCVKIIEEIRLMVYEFPEIFD